ncbi:MAG: helix-turn-helix domain-containing protein, partial [Actinomycetota bacterium]|nr:helix-turn-helix domain-containing protein [Actinomycetota bacterium]
SQVRIALATGQQQSEVSEIISGRQVQSVVLLERIADGLGVPHGWMGLAYAPDLEPEPAAPLEASTEQECRDNLLRHATTVLYGEPIFGPADPIRVTNTPTPVPRRIGLADVEHVAATTERLSRLVGDLGGIPMTEALTAHTMSAEALLGATMAPTPSAVTSSGPRRPSLSDSPLTTPPSRPDTSARRTTSPPPPEANELTAPGPADRRLAPRGPTPQT